MVSVVYEVEVLLFGNLRSCSRGGGSASVVVVVVVLAVVVVK